MNHFENFLSWSTLSFEISGIRIVFARKVYRILPFFALYTCVILASTIGVWLTYTISGYTSLTSYYAYWGSELPLNAATRSLAIVELCRYGLRAYRGIWALAWYVLTTVSILLLAHAAIDTWGQPDKVAIYGATLDRDLAFASLVILAVLFLFRKYYAIPLESPQRGIAAGICFICAFDVVMSTILRNVYAGYLFDWFLESEKARWPALRASSCALTTSGVRSICSFSCLEWESGVSRFGNRCGCRVKARSCSLLRCIGKCRPQSICVWLRLMTGWLNC